MADGIEAELKFSLGESEHRKLLGREIAGDWVLGPITDASLLARYFDTADHCLRRHGASLRLRTSDGKTEQTLKLGGSVSPLSARREWTHPVATGEPDLKLYADDADLAELLGALGHEPLLPLFEVAVRRHKREATGLTGEVVEIALDEGEVRAGAAVERFYEAELELKAGETPALFDVARALLADDIVVRFSAGSKSSRGFDLLAGESREAEPEKAKEAELSETMTVEQALLATLRSCLRQISTNVAAVEASANSEGPHQLRVGLRRLRTVLKLFRKVIAADAASRIDGEARWLGGEVGALRDLDVLREEIVGPLAGRVDLAGVDALLHELQTVGRDRLLETLAAPRANAFLLDLAAFVECRGWLSFSDLGQSGALSTPVGVFAAEAIHKHWRKVARMGRRIGTLDGEERHDLRKKFKTLRYALDFFGPLIRDKDRKRLVKDVRAAQDVLGYLNDVRMAEGLGTVLRSAPGYRGRRDKAAIEKAVGFCIGWHSATAEQVWDRAQELAALDPKDA